MTLTGFQSIALDHPTHADVVAHAPRADYLLVGGRIPIDRRILDAATRLRMVQRTGAGLDAIDLDALRARGIPLYVNPGVNAQSVAEHTLLLMLAVLRRLPLINTTLRAGGWQKHELGIGNRGLAGRRVGLIGLGHIGTAVAKLLQPFAVQLAYSKPNRLPLAAEQALGLQYLPLDQLVAQSEVLSLHCPLNPATQGLMDPQRIAAMPAGAILINTARGALVDEAALCAALRAGHLAGAGLDVFAHEPLPPDSPLRRLNNIVLSPHLGGITRDSLLHMLRRAFETIEHFDAGRLDLIAPRRLL